MKPGDHKMTMSRTDDADDNDFSMVVKNPASHPDCWHWEIYRLGRKSPILRSPEFFKTMATADLAGKAAFRRLMKDFHA